MGAGTIVVTSTEEAVLEARQRPATSSRRGQMGVSQDAVNGGGASAFWDMGFCSTASMGSWKSGLASWIFLRG
jgi:hypothetical protein